MKRSDIQPGYCQWDSGSWIELRVEFSSLPFNVKQAKEWLIVEDWNGYFGTTRSMKHIVAGVMEEELEPAVSTGNLECIRYGRPTFQILYY